MCTQEVLFLTQFNEDCSTHQYSIEEIFEGPEKNNGDQNSEFEYFDSLYVRSIYDSTLAKFDEMKKWVTQSLSDEDGL